MRVQLAARLRRSRIAVTIERTMNPLLAVTSAMLLMGAVCGKDAIVQRRQMRDTSSWRTYTNTTFRFAFRYPSHWREANTITDKANTIWINFSSSSGGATRNVLYVEVFNDRHAFTVQERLLAGNATVTPVTVDKTTQHLYGDFLDIPTAMIANNDLLVEIGDPSHEGYLEQILATFRFLK
jgi:hypothetical protein